MSSLLPQPEKNHSILLPLAFWQRRAALAWNYDFPMKSTHENALRRAFELKTWARGATRWVVLHKTYGSSYVVLLQSLLNRESSRLWKVLFLIFCFRRLYVCLHQRYSFWSIKSCQRQRDFRNVTERTKQKFHNSILSTRLLPLAQNGNRNIRMINNSTLRCEREKAKEKKFLMKLRRRHWQIFDSFP